MLHYRNRKFLLIVSILLIIGILAIYSASSVWANLKFNDEFYYMKRQVIFATIGVIVMYIVSYYDVSKLRKYAYWFFSFCIILMVLVLIPGIGSERNGSMSWFKIGPVLFQPSEFLKLALIMVVSDKLSKKRKIRKLKDVYDIMGLCLLSFGLIMLQPDFGSGVVMLSAIVIMVIVAGIPMKYFVYVVIIGSIAIVFLIMSAPYRMSRILAFIDPFSDPLGAGFQSIQSLYAIAPGGIMGMGFQNSMQKQFYLPEPHTDFIFAIIAEEMGFIGGGFLVLVFGLLFKEGLRIIKNVEDKYLKYIVIGIMALFIIQVIINLCVVVGLFPITGVT
ncbi:MAG: cell division protein FtsW [Erysipelotrichales bacterium]|nr:cell division protein FtsW [Erysipelotrichales bacterium]